MLEQIIQVEGVGLFEKALPDGPLALRKAVAVYADNGRGKSTLSCLIRSLRDNDCDELHARRTLGAEAEQRAELLIDGEKHTLSGGSWDRTDPSVHVFDDDFVEDNVSLGRVIAVMHVQELLGLMLGGQSAAPDEVVAELLEEWRDAVNARLRTFGADFEIATLLRVPGEEPPRLDYTFRLLGAQFPLAVADSSPSYPTTLGHGDRRLLALAIYLAGLDMDAGLPGLTLVLDEPASGFDGRRTTRVVEAVAELVARGAQVIVLSHRAALVHKLRSHGFDQVLQLRRVGLYGVIEDCDIDAVCAMDYTDRTPPSGPY